MKQKNQALVFLLEKVKIAGRKFILIFLYLKSPIRAFFFINLIKKRPQKRPLKCRNMGRSKVKG